MTLLLFSHHTVFNDNTLLANDDTASRSVTEDNELLSQAGSSTMDESHSKSHQNQSEIDKISNQSAVDIRQQMRKKHDRGHKKSYEKERELLLN